MMGFAALSPSYAVWYDPAWAASDAVKEMTLE
jgi:hypothetical protein